MVKTLFNWTPPLETLNVRLSVILEEYTFCVNSIASFPDSTPQAFIHSVIKSQGMESGNEAM